MHEDDRDGIDAVLLRLEDGRLDRGDIEKSFDTAGMIAGGFFYGVLPSRFRAPSAFVDFTNSTNSCILLGFFLLLHGEGRSVLLKWQEIACLRRLFS